VGRLGYRPALDGVRAIAILLVLVVHTLTVPRGGLLGVDIFFVLSGFLITTLLIEEWRADLSISLRSFYRRRMLRLFPALVALLAAFLTITAVRTTAGNNGAGHALAGTAASLFYVANIVQAWGFAMPQALKPLWSLATEEQFYVLWPPLLLLALRHRLSPRLLAWLLATVCAAIAVHRTVLAMAGEDGRLYFSPEARFDSILVGCIAGLAFTQSLRPPKWLNVPALAVVGGCVAAGPSGTIWAIVLLPFSVSVALLLLSIVEGGLLATLLARPSLVYVGRISYSLYLWHLLALTTIGLTWIPGILVAFAAAVASYEFVEKPFLRRKRWLAQPSDAKALAAAAAA
jgi:peptidoglycan/LPS O-acetylase OafA/YrhL